MIHFEKIRFKNFLSYGNSWTELDLNKHKDTLIVGENGAGKTNILDAISMFSPGKGIRNSKHENMVNNNFQKGNSYYAFYRSRIL